jgi:hypothetical protein
MPLDQRMRETFERTAAAHEPDVELRLDATLRNGIRPQRQTGFGSLLAAAAGVVVLVVVVRLAGGQLFGPGAPTSSPGASPAANDAIAGRYTVTLLASDPGITTGDLDLTGIWSMTLLPSGAMELAAPPDFAGSRAEGHAYSLEGASFRTDLWFNDYCSTVGSYTWTASSDTLLLAVADDGCQLRATLLATRAWDLAP